VSRKRAGPRARGVMKSVNQNTSGQLASDPVCGMAVDPRKAAGSFEYTAQTYFFCSLGCLKKFQTDPDLFLKVSSATSIDIQDPQKDGINHVQYTCPMHPEVRASKPASCLKCGMALEPVTVALPKEKVEYTCPMHPQIVRDAPGSCPICGMALEPRVATGEEENTELIDMKRRLWVSVLLSLPLLAIGMSDLIPGAPLARLVPMGGLPWIQLSLASPDVLWGGWSLLDRGCRPLVILILSFLSCI